MTRPINGATIRIFMGIIRDEYKDPEAAIRVLKDYEDDFLPNHRELMEKAVIDASDSTRLDVLLDQALTRLNPKLGNGACIWYDDTDAQGYSTIARRILEDG